jgi:hypothetical protein
VRYESGDRTKSPITAQFRPTKTRLGRLCNFPNNL